MSMGVMLSNRVLENPLRNTHNIVPQRLPLVLLVPHVRTLEQRDHQTLGLHKNHLGRTDLSFHRRKFPRFRFRSDVAPNRFLGNPRRIG